MLTHPGDGAKLEEQNLIRLHRVEFSLSPKPPKVTFYRVNSQTTLTEVNVSACLDSEHVNVLVQVEEKHVFCFH